MIIPDLCTFHQGDLIVTRLEIPENGMWQEAHNHAQLLLLRHALADGRILRAQKHDPVRVTLALDKIGCLACYDRPAYERAVMVLRKGPTHTRQMLEGYIVDPDWATL